MEACLHWFLWGTSRQVTPFEMPQSPVLDGPLSKRVIEKPKLSITVTSDSASVELRERIRRFVLEAQLFEYVSAKESVIEQIVSTCQKPLTEKKVSNLVQLLNQGPIRIGNPIFTDPDFADLVVLAHISKKISIWQLATMFYWKSALEHHRDKAIIEIPLFLSDGRVNQIAREVVANMVQETKGLRKTPDVALWFRAMKKEPASERVFLCSKFDGRGVEFYKLVKEKKRPYKKRAQELLTLVGDAFQTADTPTILDAICDSKPHFFHRITYKQENYQMFASLSMAKQMFAQIGKEATMVPRFGFSKTLRENGIRHERDVSLQSLYASLPNRADGFLAPHDEFTAHDLIYHAFLVSTIPKEHQRLFIELADKVREKDPKLADMIEDMENILYVLAGDGSPEEIFMRSLLNAANSIVGIKESYIYREIAQDPNRDAQKKLQDMTSLLIEGRSLKEERKKEKQGVFQLIVRSLIDVLENTVEKTPFKQVLFGYLKTGHLVAI